MGTDASVLLMLALTACVALLGPGMISIEDTREKKPRSPRETGDLIQEE